MSEQVPSNPLAFLDAPASEPEPTQQAQVQPEATPSPQVDEPAPDGPQRGPDGKFVAKAGDAPAEPAPEPETPAPAAAEADSKIPDGLVPVSALQALRDEIKALKNPPAQPAPPSPPREAPDPELDPEAHRIFNEMSQEQWQERRVWSGKLAESKYGKEAVEAAHTWGFDQQGDPQFKQRLLLSRDPYEFLVSEHRKARVLDTLSAIDDPAKLDRLLAALAGGDTPAPATPAVATPPPPSPPAPRSIATAPGNGIGGIAAIPVGPGQAFDAVFKG